MEQHFFKVRGDTLEDAYRMLRRQLGNDAVVINTHQVSEGGLFGFFARKRVEITASAPAPVTAPAPPRTPSAVERKYAMNNPTAAPAAPASGRTEQYEQLIRDAQRRMSGGNTAPAPAPVSAAAHTPLAEGATAPAPVVQFPRQAPGESAAELRREMQEIREMLQVLYAESPATALPPEFAPHYRTLVERGVSRKVAAALLGAVVRDGDVRILADPRVFHERIRNEVRRAVRVTGGIALEGGKRKIVALCGATGVGKTTNLAKLAAHFGVQQRARVALITADNYRVAAPEQLRIYGNIIGLPLRVANDAREIRAALDEFRDYDLVLLDTAGGSQFNLEQINELKRILAVAQPHETILVMSACTQYDDLRNVVTNFKCVNPTSVMFTKLDETRHYGVIFSILAESGLPLSYFSVGQNVPDDLRVASTNMIAHLILEGAGNRG